MSLLRWFIRGVWSISALTCLAAPAWAQDMRASVKVTGGGTYDYVVVGGMNGALDGLDNIYDTVSPGPNMNDTFVYTYIPHPEWGAIKDDFRADIRSSQTNQAWVIKVSTNLPAGTPLAVSLDGTTTNVPEGYTLTVTDSDTEAMVVLDSSASYQFTVPVGGATKEIIIGAQYVPPVIEDPVITEDPAETEDPTEGTAMTEDSTAADETTASSEDADTEQELTVPNDDLNGHGITYYDTHFLSMGEKGSQPTKQYQSRAIPHAPAIREHQTPATDRNVKHASLSPELSGGLSAPRLAAKREDHEQVKCRTVDFSSGDSIIYCGKKISREEILKRVSRGKTPEEKDPGIAAKYNGSSILRHLIGRLDVDSVLPASDTAGSAPSTTLSHGLFEKIKRLSINKIALNGISRLVDRNILNR